MKEIPAHPENEPSRIALTQDELHDLAERMAVWLYQYEKHASVPPTKKDVVSGLIGRDVRMPNRNIRLDEAAIDAILGYLRQHGEGIDLEALLMHAPFKMF